MVEADSQLEQTMFTTRVEKVLVAQIQHLKDQLAKSESERRELLKIIDDQTSLQTIVAGLSINLEESQRQYRHLSGALDCLDVFSRQIVFLTDQLEKAETERRELQNRLLERNHYAPISSQSAPTQENKLPAIEVISPWGTPQPELFDAIKESYLAEEIVHIMNHEGIIDSDRARLIAEDRFLETYRARG